MTLDPLESNMNPSFSLETLENRQLLSVAAPVLAEVQPLVQPAVMVKVVQPKLTANSYYLGSPTLSGISGKLALKIKTAYGTAVTATLYSTDFGGFNVDVTGTVSTAGALSLTGKSSTCRVSSFKANLGSGNKVITGSCTIVQMGFTIKGAITETRTTTPPVLKTVTYPSLLGKYTGVASNGNRPTITITKQTGGLFWGTAIGSAKVVSVITGFQSSPGVFRMHGVASDGYSNTSGTVLSDGALNCSVAWHDNDGSKGTQTFVAHKV